MTTFVVTGADLHAAAAWAARIVPNRPAVPLLGGLLMEARDVELVLSATDYDTSASVVVPAVVKNEGRTLLSARLLVDVAKTVARDVDVTIESTPGGAEVRCGRAEWSVPVLPVEEYPQLPVGSDPHAAVDADVLRVALGRVLPAVSREVNKDLEQLRGVRLESPTPGVLTLVATDRYRLATADIALADPASELPDALVPGELLDSAARAMHTGLVSLSGTDHTFGLATDTHQLLGRQIAAEFPRWRGFMPEPTDHQLVVESADLAHAIEQARVMSTADESANVLVTFAPDGVAVSADDGSRKARAEIAVQSMTGETVEGKFRPAYLREALAAVGSDAVVVELYPRRQMAVFTAADADAGGAPVPGYRHLVMMTKGIRR